MGRDLLFAVGWSVVVGFGLALGLYIGSLSADVPADTEMLVFTAVVAAAGTLVVRVTMAIAKHRPGRAGSEAAARATADAAAGSTEGAEAAAEPEKTGKAGRGGSQPARRRGRPLSARPSGTGKSDSGDTSKPSGSGKSGSGRAPKRPASRRPGGSSGGSRRRPR